MSVINKDLGVVTAYAYAVEAGYTGTEEEFEQALGDLAELVTDFENFTVEVTTLEPGSSATASYADGVLSLGIPEGEKGDTGATPNLTIGTVTTLAPGSDATATITGTAEAPVLSLGIPEGDPGEVPAAALASDFSASVSYKKGDYVWKSGTLYEFTADHAAGAWTGSDATAAKVADDVADLKSAISVLDDTVGIAKNLLAYLTTAGAIQKADGVPKTTGSAITDYYKYSPDFIPVRLGEKLSYALRTPTNYMLIAFYTSASESSYVQGNSVEGTGAISSGIYIVPANGYIRLTCRNEVVGKSADLAMSNSLIDKVAENTSDISDIESDISGLGTDIGNLEIALEANESEDIRVMHDVFSLGAYPSEDGYINGVGAVVTHASYTVTDYIPILAGEKFSYRLSHGAVSIIIAFYTGKDASTYDSTKTVYGINGYSEGEFTASVDGYVRCVYQKAKPAVWAIFTDDIPDNVKRYVLPDVLNGLNILCLGDSIFGNDGEIVADINDLSSAHAVNCAFGGTRVSVRSTGDFQYFDGVNLVTAITTQTWTDQDAAASALAEDYPWVPTRLATLKAIDMSEIDLITMNWGTNDYTAGATISEITSAYNAVIDALQEAYPGIRLLIITPIWRYFGAKSDNENGDNKVYNVSTLKEISSAIDQNSKDKRIESLYMYQKMPLSYNTADLYFDAGDETHLNTAGNLVYAHILLGKLRSMY